jgi:hypothetical protein
MTISVPTIHMNGTSKNALIAQILEVRKALSKVFTAMADASPNGRDYYPQGDQAIIKAGAGHRSRLERLTSVYAELGEIAEAIDGR